ncbi:unnamed protein product [Prorocentrum cordatum]|uniref:Uncharacterized protein n=1 Tax=Prorocentrum cordatum TaxID=2364126 RepID=A0ABN9TJE1_9DINO|nr:unnamed protein product [Polarella glacialis]
MPNLRLAEDDGRAPARRAGGAAAGLRAMGSQEAPCTGAPGPGACRVERRPLPAGPAAAGAPGASRRGPLAGRWVVVSEAGDCLVDCPAEADAAEESLPLATLCPLAAAVLQFVAAACAHEGRQHAPTWPPTHAFAFSGLLLVACGADGFAVAAARTLPDADAESPEYEMLEATLRYKALELHASLRGAAGGALRAAAAASGRAREAQLGAYSLGSMLEPGGPEAAAPCATELAPRAAAAVQDLIMNALRATYAGALTDALDALDTEEPLCGALRRRPIPPAAMLCVRCWAGGGGYPPPPPPHPGGAGRAVFSCPRHRSRGGARRPPRRLAPAAAGRPGAARLRVVARRHR